jgi:hypothetical protein
MGDVSIWHWIVVLVPVAVPLILKFGFDVGAKKFTIKNPTTGQLKDGFFGFSWTYFYFSFFVPLIRGEIGIAALHLIFSIITLGLWQFIFAFFYNKQYTQRLIAQGFKFSDTEERNVMAAKRIGIDLDTHLKPAIRL